MIVSIEHISGENCYIMVLIELIKSMYTKFKYCVRNNGKSTETFDVTVGVLQGEALSPFLFPMYLNDFESFLMKNGSDGIEIGMLNLFLIL